MHRLSDVAGFASMETTKFSYPVFSVAPASGFSPPGATVVNCLVSRYNGQIVDQGHGRCACAVFLGKDMGAYNKKEQGWITT